MFKIETCALSVSLVLAACGSSAGSDQDAGAVDGAEETPIDASNVDPLTVVGRGTMATAGDVAADPTRNLVAVNGFFGENLVLFDVSDPSAPEELADLDIGYNTDVQFLGTVLYVNHEQIGRGFDIYDTSTPDTPVLVRSIDQNTGTLALNDCHNLWPQPDRGLLYCASTATGEVVIMAIGDGGVGSPTNPVFLRAFGSPNGGIGVHDVYGAANTLYVAFLDGGLAVYDITDASDPQLRGTVQYEGNFTHNVWPAQGGDYVFTTDEVVGGKLRVWDVRDVTNIAMVAEYGRNDEAIIHNVEVVADRAYVSYYTEGIVVLDVSDPTAPTEIAAYDMVDGPDQIPGEPFSGLRGAWGIEPAPPLIYVSDTTSGLWVFRLNK